MNISLKITGIGFLFVLIILSGIWLTKTGKPYPSILFNAHKLLSLAGTILAGIVAYQLQKPIELSTQLTTIVIVTGIFLLVLIITGGLLNLEKSFFQVLRIIHRILSPLTIALVTLTFYLLMKK